MLEKGESVQGFDCNTVGPVPVASGYGSRTLTQSAAHLLICSKENASALSLVNEKRHVKSGDSCLRELSETKAGVPKTSENVDNTTSGVLRDNSGPTRGSHAVEGVAKITSFTGSTTPVLPETKNSSVKFTYFTLYKFLWGSPKFSTFDHIFIRKLE